MGSDVGQIFPTASLHRDHSISYALVCEKELSHMGKTTEIPIWCARIYCSIPGDVKFPVQDNSLGKISQFIGSSCKICTTRSMLTPLMGPEIIQK